MRQGIQLSQADMSESAQTAEKSDLMDANIWWTSLTYAYIDILILCKKCWQTRYIVWLIMIMIFTKQHENVKRYLLKHGHVITKKALDKTLKLTRWHQPHIWVWTWCVQCPPFMLLQTVIITISICKKNKHVCVMLGGVIITEASSWSGTCLKQCIVSAKTSIAETTHDNIARQTLHIWMVTMLRMRVVVLSALNVYPVYHNDPPTLINTTFMYYVLKTDSHSKSDIRQKT